MFKKIKTEDIGNVFNLISKDWMLIAAKNGDKVNAMTASWGGMGHLWHKDVVYIFVRPQRYTYEFIENSDEFTLTFLPEQYREKLNYMGKVSGRNEDKILKSGLSVYEKDEYPYFEEGKMVIKCKKIYRQRLDKDCFIDPALNEFYKGDYHYMYVGEIVEVLGK